MTPRYLDLNARKDRILSITIDQYIQSVSPVSSSCIAKRYFPELSSATIRNILAELEQEGYLTHPHTSAGRVPTQKGYRYYVDNLMNEIQLLEDEKERINEEYNKVSLELETLLEKTSRTIADTIHYTSIISIDGLNNKIFCKGMNYIVGYPEYQDIKKIESILSALEEKEQLLKIINRDLHHKIDIYIGHEIALSKINSCSLVVSQYVTKKGSSGRIAVLGPTRMNYERVVSTLDYFTSLIEDVS